MAIIRAKNMKDKQILKAKVTTETLVKIEKYCEWAGIYDLGFFIEEAAHYVFKKDDEWQHHQEKTKTTEEG